MGAVTKLIKMALENSSEKLSKKYTGKTLTNILKSISKNKTGLEEQGIKVGPLKKKVASAKNKRRDYVIDQDAENRYGTIAQGARKDGKEVPLTLRGIGGAIKGGKAILKKYKPRKPSKKVQQQMMDENPLDARTKPKKVMQTIRRRNKKRNAAAQKEHNKFLKSMGLSKKKKGGMIGNGNQFVASLYKGDK